METKLHKTTLADWVEVEYPGDTSGFEVLGDRVLVLPDQAAEKTQGGVHLTPEYVGRMNLAAETGVVVKVGNGAFVWNSDRQTPYQGIKPSPGDRVYIERYSGQLMHGRDGLIYRLMESACVGAVERKS